MDRLIVNAVEESGCGKITEAPRYYRGQREKVTRGIMETNRDGVLYGAPRKAPAMYRLHAGPASMKFQDGELRYLYVGDKEIVRRVYFGVRDERWDTVMPELSDINVQQTDVGFKISFSAVCRNDIADYSWHGEIHGGVDGKIVFAVNGAANAEFKSPRIGINILFGAGSLAGQAYEVVDGKGAATADTFPLNVSEALLAECNSFQTLHYTAADGMTVSTGLDTKCVGMEDQRNFGDSSYKAFSSIPYEYPTVREGDRRNQIFTLEVKNVADRVSPMGTIHATISHPMAGAKMPRLMARGAPPKSDFQTYNREPRKYAGVELVAMPYNPAAHMPDDDTFMENIPTILDWVRSIRAFAPKARFRFDPIDFESPYPRASADPRNASLFAAPWCTRVVKYLALGGVEEAAFALDTDYAAAILRRLAPFADRRALTVDISGGTPLPIDVLAVEGDGETIVWLMNLTDQPQQVSLCGLGKMRGLYSASMDTLQGLAIDSSAIMLGPFDVLEVSAEK